ncbi:unnamed protein product [Linum trigynum]|uniref:Major facilitator superfamily (MFS) profile domain-containing protein n=1 Tax=Linum trigynum TaxID=586398 RepID=A0AAV2D8H0_9ROSI
MTTAAPLKRFTIILCLCIIVSQATLLFSFGYETCMQLLSTATTMEHDLNMTAEQLQHFLQDTKYTFFLTCLLSGFSADYLGRRSTLMISGALSSFGFLIMSLAVSYGVLMMGRVISLAGLGLGFPVAPLYIGEIAPPSRRGLLNTIPEVFWSLAVWLTVITRAAVRDLPASSQWRVLLSVGAVPSLILGVGMVFMPESPCCWLIRHARVADAKTALGRILETSDEVEERLSTLREAARIPPTMGDVNFKAVPEDIQFLGIWHDFRRPVVRPV